jgi:hypothetical protein
MGSSIGFHQLFYRVEGKPVVAFGRTYEHLRTGMVLPRGAVENVHGEPRLSRHFAEAVLLLQGDSGVTVTEFFANRRRFYRVLVHHAQEPELALLWDLHRGSLEYEGERSHRGAALAALVEGLVIERSSTLIDAWLTWDAAWRSDPERAMAVDWELLGVLSDELYGQMKWGSANWYGATERWRLSARKRQLKQLATAAGWDAYGRLVEESEPGVVARGSWTGDSVRRALLHSDALPMAGTFTASATGGGSLLSLSADSAALAF